MLKSVLRIFRGEDRPVSTAHERHAGFPVLSGIPSLPPEDGDEDPLRDVPRYPPFDSGIPITPISRVLTSQGDLISRIYRTAGVSRQDFDLHYQQAIDNLAAYVHLLPATDVNNHQGAGGLFCFALEVGLYSLQAANASVFPAGGGVERRFYMEPKWRLATFLAAICSQLYRVVGSMVVVSREQEQWQPLLSPVYTWALSIKTDRYFIRWLEEPNLVGAQASSAYIANQIVSVEVMQYLAADNNMILTAMSGAFTGGVTGENPILKIISPITTQVIVMDQKRSLHNYGHMIVGSHIETHLIDAMIRLIRNGTWAWNCKDAIVWIGTDGVFLEWARAASEIVNLLGRDGYAGIPKDQDTLAEILAKCKVLELTRERNKYWSILPMEATDRVDGVVKLVEPKQIFPEGFDYEALGSVALIISAQAPDRAAVKEPNAKSTKSTSQTRERKGPGHSQAKSLESASLELFQAPVDSVEPTIAQTTPATAVDEWVESETAAYSEHTDTSEASVQHQADQEVPAWVHDMDASMTLCEPDRPKRSPSKAPHSKEPHWKGKDLDAQSATNRINELKPASARLMQAIVDSHGKGTVKGVIAKLPDGLGIDFTELHSHGRPPFELIDELRELQWVRVDPTKPTKTLLTVKISGQEHRMVILKHEIARDLGFN